MPERTNNILSNVDDRRRKVPPQRRRLAPTIQSPEVSDAVSIRRLVHRTPALDPNSSYAYLLLCTDFAQTSAVARVGDEVVAFVLGYCPPERPDTYFVWQVAVSPAHRGQGLGTALLDHVIGSLRRRGITHLEATVTPSNEASWSLFRGFARRRGLACSERSAFPSHLFSEDDHEDEVRITIGPLDRPQAETDPDQEA